MSGLGVVLAGCRGQRTSGGCKRKDGQRLLSSIRLPPAAALHLSCCAPGRQSKSDEHHGRLTGVLHIRG